MKKTESQEQNVSGVIEPDKTYTKKEFMSITGKGRHAFAECKKRGLRVLKDGRTPLIYGQDYINYLLKINGRMNDSPSPN
ncbi:hypothetical protein CA11_25420 [Gimesia maris]|uniref:hypothetical protein n=1 Tax=Gimesia maris TaxID=122 RepID=UPI001188B8C7|nr:hypothetical protein [Gimesia maris]QDU14732.1 hypothetical protein CA11_25420 [Gimesia maris]